MTVSQLPKVIQSFLFSSFSISFTTSIHIDIAIKKPSPNNVSGTIIVKKIMSNCMLNLLLTYPYYRRLLFKNNCKVLLDCSKSMASYIKMREYTTQRAFISISYVIEPL